MIVGYQVGGYLMELKRALSMYVPSDAPEANTVILKRKDAGNLATWDELNTYDKILLRFSCFDRKAFRNALRSVKVGGSVVYSTCTLSSIQNEAVVENGVAIAEQKFGVRVVEESLSQLVTHLASSGLYRFSDQCRTGALVLPFLPSNFGPMYVCKLTRIA
ncbi:unnamed protein product [Strongylus vulgaris]|uniref:NOL1/NOP2/Sun domain family member 4 n=1 Tax=Strongylus vulgaris TaxID=40348 RepID=A0A3P7JL87_STRVU|nr:unnamed protein product [Strongylus vulgaris]